MAGTNHRDRSLHTEESTTKETEKATNTEPEKNGAEANAKVMKEKEKKKTCRRGRGDECGIEISDESH